MICALGKNLLLFTGVHYHTPFLQSRDLVSVVKFTSFMSNLLFITYISVTRSDSIVSIRLGLQHGMR